MAASFEKLRPPLSYYGGKQRLASRIVSLIPEHRIYVEPFAGGLAVLFRKGIPQIKNYVEVINDTDSRIVNFYRTLQDPKKRVQLSELLKFTPYSRALYYSAKKAVVTGDLNTIDSLPMAYYTYIAVNWAFSGNIGTGWSYSKIKNMAATLSRKNKTIENLAERLQQVYIDCQDVKKIISVWDSKESFFYLDPPYPGCDQGHYSGYRQDDFIELMEILKRLEGKFILSCYLENLCGLDIPTTWQSCHIKAVASSSCKKFKPCRTEILLRNF